MSAAGVQEVHETESDLVARAQTAVSQCNWVVGECAAQWTKKYARGRTDGDFGLLVGLSADQVYQRRRTWETFGDVVSEYALLKWSHFYVALNWNDAPECLQWAQENEATVAEMKAWRRTMHGEEAEAEIASAEWGAPVSYVSGDVRPVRDPDEFGEGEGGGARNPSASNEMSATMAGFARESDANAPPWEGDDSVPAPVPPNRGSHEETQGPSLEQIVKRMAATLEKISRTITPEFAESFHGLPPKLKSQFLRATENLQEKLADLGG